MIEDHLSNSDIYPITIIRDRYTGTYSKGKYLAFNLDFDEIPSAINSDDRTCDQFWCDARHLNLFIGKGNTILEAMADLESKLKASPSRVYRNYLDSKSATCPFCRRDLGNDIITRSSQCSGCGQALYWKGWEPDDV